MSHFSKTLMKFGVLILVINMIGIWTILLLDHRKLSKLQAFENNSRTSTVNNKLDPKTGETSTFSEIDERLTEVEKTQDGFSTRLNTLETSFSTLEEGSNTPVRSTGSTNTKAQKEYTIYLGEGETTSREWTTVQATTLSLDTNKYPGLSTVYFEAALSTNGGEAYAQLIDAETGAIFSSPALMNNTANPTWKTGKVNLSSGTHTYVVQLKSSSGEMVNLSGSRLRIVAN